MHCYFSINHWTSYTFSAICIQLPFGQSLHTCYLSSESQYLLVSLPKTLYCCTYPVQAEQENETMSAAKTILILYFLLLYTLSVLQPEHHTFVCDHYSLSLTFLWLLFVDSALMLRFYFISISSYFYVPQSKRLLGWSVPCGSVKHRVAVTNCNKRCLSSWAVAWSRSTMATVHAGAVRLVHNWLAANTW